MSVIIESYSKSTPNAYIVHSIVAVFIGKTSNDILTHVKFVIVVRLFKYAKNYQVIKKERLIYPNFY